MRFNICLLLIALIGVSCQKDKTTNETLFGDWKYEREISETFNFLLDFDIEGTISFQSDNKGSWKGKKELYNYDIVWNLDEVSQMIEIKKYPIDQSQLDFESRVFDVKQVDEDNIKLTYQMEVETIFSDPPNTILYFVNIYLSRYN